MSQSLAIPSTLTVGDSWSFEVTISDYDRPTWTATLYLLPTSGSNISVVSTGIGPSHTFLAAAATTATYSPGKYRWQVRVSDGTDKYTIDAGWITLENDPAASGARDLRSWARRTLEAIEATLEGRASSDQMSYAIQGRALSRIPLTELTEWRDKLRKEVRAEDSAQKQGKGRNIKVRFQRP